ncbi:rhs element Vgr family protein, partial [Vibrio harveyi]
LVGRRFKCRVLARSILRAIRSRLMALPSH